MQPAPVQLAAAYNGRVLDIGWMFFWLLYRIWFLPMGRALDGLSGSFGDGIAEGVAEGLNTAMLWGAGFFMALVVVPSAIALVWLILGMWVTIREERA